MESSPSVQNNDEKMPTQRADVVAVLREKGREDMSLLSAWIDENKQQIRTITDWKEQRRADFAFEIEKIKVYVEAGFLDEARDELAGSQGVEGMIDVALSDQEIKQVNDLLDEILRLR